MNFRKLITNERQVIQLVSDSFDQKTKYPITYFNQHCFNIYTKNKDYKYLIDEVFQTYIDGTGIRLALNLFGYKTSSRFNASDLNEKLLKYFKNKNYRVYIVGGNIPRELIFNRVSHKLIPFGYNDGYFKRKDESGIIQKIIDSNPEVIIVGMGVPKQELFSAKLAEELPGKTIICVGNFLEFYYGTINRIPRIFRNLGVEWIFRLISEPKRLWKRYIIGIPIFFVLVVKEYFRKGK